MQRPQTSVPTSQRLGRNVRSEHGDVISHPGSARPATPGKNVLARPPSSFAAFNHVNRLGTINSGNYVTIGGGERPITQHGVAGMRPGTGRGMTRHVQDKRYYLSLLQLKIRDLTQEISTILRDVETQTKERTKFHHYDKLAKDLASELTDLQSQLADYNTIVDKLTSNVTKAEIEEETHELFARNESSQFKIEEMLEERFEIEQKAREIAQLFENRTRNSANIISNMAAAERAKFESLQLKQNNLNRTLNELQAKLDDLNATELNLEREFDGSTLKQEAARLEHKLIELLERKARLLKEERKKVSPEDEKQEMLNKVKMENLQISAAEAQLNEINKRVRDGERLLERLQAETEDNETEKRLKFQELKKRENVIEDFMTNFEQNKENEAKKLKGLENLTVEYLTKLSKYSDENDENFGNFLNFDENTILKKTGEIVNLNFNFNSNENNGNNENNEIEKLSKLRQMKIEMEILINKIENESKEIAEKIGINSTNHDLNNLNETDLKQEELKLKLKNEELMKEEEKMMEELKEIKMEFEGRKIMINNDNLMKEIHDLQVKEADLKMARKLAADLNEKERNSIDFGKIKGNALKSIEFYNNSLKDGLKNVFSLVE